MTSTLLKFLSTIGKKHNKVYYIPNGGNAGDALINVGFYSAAAKAHLQYVEIPSTFDFSKISDDDVLLFPGGGNLVPNWTAGTDLLNRLLDNSFPIVLMPQSIHGRTDALLRLRGGDVVFVREEFTASYLYSIGLKASIYVDHDCAFYIDKKLLSEDRKALPTVSAKNAIRALLILYHFIRSRFIKEVDAMRVDSESAFGGRASIFNDLSIICSFGTQDRRQNIVTARWFLRTLSWYQRIRTDRLHVMIGCVLTRTSVEAFPNSYHKVQGVFEHSIARNPEYSKYVTWTPVAKGAPRA